MSSGTKYGHLGLRCQHKILQHPVLNTHPINQDSNNTQPDRAASVASRIGRRPTGAALSMHYVLVRCGHKGPAIPFYR